MVEFFKTLGMGILTILILIGIFSFARWLYNIGYWDEIVLVGLLLSMCYGIGWVIRYGD